MGYFVTVPGPFFVYNFNEYANTHANVLIVDRQSQEMLKTQGPDKTRRLLVQKPQIAQALAQAQIALGIRAPTVAPAPRPPVAVAKTMQVDEPDEEDLL